MVPWRAVGMWEVYCIIRRGERRDLFRSLEPPLLAKNREMGHDASDYWRWAEAPAASSRKVVRKPAAVFGSYSASSEIVAENWGDSGRKRTCSTSCWRTVIRVLSS